MIKFKLYSNEDYDEQREKHKAYLREGFKLVSQKKKKNGIVVRKYEKTLRTES